MLTECEWRKQAARKRLKKGLCWGAQYMLPTRAERLMNDRSFRLFLLITSIVLAAMMPLLVPSQERRVFADAVVADLAANDRPREIRAVSYVLPADLVYTQQTFTRQQLLYGKMMLIDQAHPLPKEIPPPNTYSIAVQARGSVPVASLQLKSGLETIEALTEWFSVLPAGLMVTNATRSMAEQQTIREQHVRALMQSMTPESAVKLTNEQLDLPGQGELQQEYTVDIHASTPQQEQALLQTSWRYGFVRSPNGDSRFRWVGKAHATAMTYLNVSLKEYLLWLHEKGTLIIMQNQKPRYVIFSKPMTGTHIAFDLPVDAEVEISLDNMGYAVVACTLP